MSDLAASGMESNEGPISAAMSGRRSMVPKRFTPRKNRLASRRLHVAGHSCPSSSTCQAKISHFRTTGVRIIFDTKGQRDGGRERGRGKHGGREREGGRKEGGREGGRRKGGKEGEREGGREGGKEGGRGGRRKGGGGGGGESGRENVLRPKEQRSV